MRVVGYHGTSGADAARILAVGFTASRNDYDWLGDGAYFFQDAPARAREWARRRFPTDPAVVAAEIDLDGCIDLLDIRWNAVIRESYATLVKLLVRDGLPVPRQTVGAHRLDREVIEQTVGVLASAGVAVRSVRASFQEGKPLYPGSALYDESHVQIAVRHPDAIIRTWRVK